MDELQEPDRKCKKVASSHPEISLADLARYAQYSMEEMTALLDKKPSILKTRIVEEHHLLTLFHHFASIDNIFSTKVLEMMLQRYPEGAKCAGNNQCLPLHVACVEGNIDHIQLLVQYYPEGLQTKAFGTKLPLSFALRHVQDADHIDIIRFLVNGYPAGLKAPDNDSSLPIHIIVGDDFYPFEFVKFIVETYPESLSVRDKYGKLAFHNFVLKRNNFSPQEAKILLRMNPVALFCKFHDSTGSNVNLLQYLTVKAKQSDIWFQCLKKVFKYYYPAENPQMFLHRIEKNPVHICIDQWKGSFAADKRVRLLEVITWLIESVPKLDCDCGTQRDLSYMHYAADELCSCPVLLWRLLRMDPGALEKLDYRGSFPLLSRLQIVGVCFFDPERPEWNEQKNVINMILKESRATTRIFSGVRQDNSGISGALALHHALEWNVPFCILKDILEHNPQAVDAATKDGHKYKPAHVAALHYNTPDGLYLILREDPNLLQTCFHLCD